MLCHFLQLPVSLLKSLSLLSISSDIVNTGILQLVFDSPTSGGPVSTFQLSVISTGLTFNILTPDISNYHWLCVRGYIWKNYLLNSFEWDDWMHESRHWSWTTNPLAFWGCHSSLDWFIAPGRNKPDLDFSFFVPVSIRSQLNNFHFIYL